MGGSRDSGTGCALVGVSRQNFLPYVYSVLCQIKQVRSFLLCPPPRPHSTVPSEILFHDVTLLTPCPGYLISCKYLAGAFHHQTHIPPAV